LSNLISSRINEIMKICTPYNRGRTRFSNLHFAQKEKYQIYYKKKIVPGGCHCIVRSLSKTRTKLYLEDNGLISFSFTSNQGNFQDFEKAQLVTICIWYFYTRDAFLLQFLFWFSVGLEKFKPLKLLEKGLIN
jgi:hypothetical protein